MDWSTKKSKMWQREDGIHYMSDAFDKGQKEAGISRKKSKIR